MTRRDDQIAAAAETLDEELANCGTWLNGVLPVAHAIVDAVLPRVTTEEQRSAVPPGTVVVSDAGTLAGRYDTTRAVVLGDERPIPWADLALPLTIVWQPS